MAFRSLVARFKTKNKQNTTQKVERKDTLLEVINVIIYQREPFNFKKMSWKGLHKHLLPAMKNWIILNHFNENQVSNFKISIPYILKAIHFLQLAPGIESWTTPPEKKSTSRSHVVVNVTDPCVRPGTDSQEMREYRCLPSLSRDLDVGRVQLAGSAALIQPWLIASSGEGCVSTFTKGPVGGLGGLEF